MRTTPRILLALLSIAAGMAGPISFGAPSACADEGLANRDAVPVVSHGSGGS